MKYPGLEIPTVFVVVRLDFAETVPEPAYIGMSQAVRVSAIACPSD